jgi:hypothetical protein
VSKLKVVIELDLDIPTEQYSGRDPVMGEADALGRSGLIGYLAELLSHDVSGLVTKHVSITKRD